MTNDSPEQMVQSIYKKEIESSEMMTKLFSEYDKEVAINAMIDVFNDMVENIESQDRLKRVVILLDNFGRSVGSERLVERAADEANHNDDLVLRQER